MRPEALRSLLEKLAQGEISVDAAYRTLEGWPFVEVGAAGRAKTAGAGSEAPIPLEDREASVAKPVSIPRTGLGAKLDVQREVRRGLPEAVYCEGKSPEQVQAIFQALAARERFVLGTRATPAHAESVRAVLPHASYDPVSRLLVAGELPPPDQPGPIAVVSAGSADEPVAKEAEGTLAAFGHPVVSVADAGVAGLQRIFAHLELLKQALVVIVVAGMDGALPSVVAGLIPTPVIAVPTSVGYGASFGGLSALLAMLNSCAGGVTVVNIDNGFGAAYAASLIARKVTRT